MEEPSEETNALQDPQQEPSETPEVEKFVLILYEP